MTKLNQIAFALASALLLSAPTATAATLSTASAPVGDAVLIAQEADTLEAGDTIVIEDAGEEFTADAEYEVQEDADDGDLFVEDDNGETWNIVSMSEDGDEVELEFDGRTVSADDVD